jgi:hypothetical protein
MTANQFKQKLLKLGFRTHAQAAEALGVGRTTVTMWTTGANSVPAWAVLFLQCLEAKTQASPTTKPENP